MVRILMVDDNLSDLNALEEMLKKVCPNAEIFSFDKPAEALAFSESNYPDIAFLGTFMTKTEIVELVLKHKRLNPRMNIIFVAEDDTYAGVAMRLHVSGYLLKPVTLEAVEYEIINLRYAVDNREKALLRVLCFGNFDVFTMDGKPLHFGRTKSKELFAYLVHRQGASCTVREIAAILFEDEPYDQKQQNYVQKVISIMMQTLRQARVEAVIIKRYNSLAVDTQLVDCDYYRYCEMNPDLVRIHEREYMSQYDWAMFFSGFTK